MFSKLKTIDYTFTCLTIKIHTLSTTRKEQGYNYYGNACDKNISLLIF